MAANPENVYKISSALADSLKTSVDETMAYTDLVSAAFTFLWQVLRICQEKQAPEEKAHNAKEIQRVLLDFLTTFGPDDSIKQ